jgi:glycine hydroxymethyltransferase
MQDKKIEELIRAEHDRQAHGLEMIPSENHASAEVLAALGSVMTDKYSEGYPGQRYYGGCEFVDKSKILHATGLKNYSGLDHANVQAYSGSPANQAVFLRCWTRAIK